MLNTYYWLHRVAMRLHRAASHCRGFTTSTGGGTLCSNPPATGTYRGFEAINHKPPSAGKR
jgi:hypothetical protein